MYVRSLKLSPLGLRLDTEERYTGRNADAAARSLLPTQRHPRRVRGGVTQRRPGNALWLRRAGWSLAVVGGTRRRNQTASEVTFLAVVTPTAIVGPLRPPAPLTPVPAAVGDDG